MAEYKLSYTANEIDERLGKVSALENKVNEMITNSVQADWNQNDETALDYIKNKPFYSTGEYEYEEILNASATCIYNNIYSIAGTMVLSAGQQYQVIINEEQEFLCTAQSDGSENMILGNPDKNNWEGAEPFHITARGVAWTDPSFTLKHVSVKKPIEIIKSLDKKYIASYMAGENVKGKEVSYDGKDYVCEDGAEVFNMNNIAIGYCSHAEGSNTIALGDYSHAEGSGSKALGDIAHAEGYLTSADRMSHAEGVSTIASDLGAHAEGQNTQATYAGAHAEGRYTQATEMGAHAEGHNTIANTPYLHAQGRYNLADELIDSNYSLSWVMDGPSYSKYDGEQIVYLCESKPAFDNKTGVFTVGNTTEVRIKDLKANDYILFSKPESEIISTYYIIESLKSQETNEETGVTLYQWNCYGAMPVKQSSTGRYAHIVGNGGTVVENGTSKEIRSNAHTLDWDGNAWYQGTLKLGGSSYDDANEVALKSEVEELREALQTVTEELNALKESLNS